MEPQKSKEFGKIIEEFREYLQTNEGRTHLDYLKVKEPKETKEVLEKLKKMDKNSEEFVDLVLYGLLPNAKSKYAKRVSIAPAFMNIKKFFGRFNYSDSDWRNVANLIFKMILGFSENPDNLGSIIERFSSNKYSRRLQCGSITPILYALNNNFPIVNSREIRTYKELSKDVLGKPDQLSRKLNDYLSNCEKLQKFARVLNENYGFKEINDMAILDLFCFWFDECKREAGRTKKPKKARLKKKEDIIPIEEKYVTKFLQTLACSPPQPFQVETLLKLDSENKIIYNTEFQRGEVWNLPRKQKLIDSILRGYNINTIFLRQLSDSKYECLDGQQRLKTILKEFLSNQFPVNPKFSPEFNKKTFFDQLPESLKSKIRSYIIYAIIFYTDDDEETCRIFLRLQEGLPLNSPEKLNAMMGFIRNEIVELSKHPFMKKLGVKDHRFAHRYILAQAYLMTLRDQVTDVKFRNLREIYGNHKQTRPPQGVTDTVKKVLRFLDRSFNEDAKTIRFKADFISLYLFAKSLIENYVTDNIGDKLKEFFIQFLVRVGEVESSEREEDAAYYDYKTYRKSSADSRNSIEKRFNIILSKFLEFVPGIKPKDPIRGFNYWEKLAVYRRDKGICQTCGKRIPFEEGSVDHKVPHSKGGPTTIANGQWLCRKCNLKKLDKMM